LSSDISKPVADASNGTAFITMRLIVTCVQAGRHTWSPAGV